MTDESFRKTPPAVEEMTAFRLPPMRRRILPSGIELFIYDGCTAPVTNLSLISPGGDSEYGSLARSTLSANLRREGTLSLPGAEINSRLDFNGAQLMLGSSSHHQSQNMRVLNSRLKDTLPIFRSMALEPTMDPEALAVRREALARNIEVAMTDVDFLARCASDRLIMGSDHPRARIDTPDEIRAITSEVLLEDYRRIMSVNRSRLYLSGNVTEEVEKLVADTFSDIPAASTDSDIYVIRGYNPAPALTEERIVKPDARQSSVMITLPAIPRNHPDYIMLHIAVSALGGYFGSRLMLNIRERLGLTYGISATLNGTRDGAYIQIQADTDASHVDELRRQVSAELRRMHTDPPSGDELRRLRQSLLSSQAALLDSPLTISEYYVTAYTAGIPDGYFEAKLHSIADLRPEQIAAISERYLDPDAVRTAIAGA